MKAVGLTVCAALAGACTIDWPAHSRGDLAGPAINDNGPLHRPGQPCLWCHGGPSSTAPEWAVAGTVYRQEADSDGVGGAVVTMIDADGKEFDVTTNSVGNFYVNASGGGGNPREGELIVASAPVYPLTVKVTVDGTTTAMRSAVHRDGSCAGCHREPAGAALVGKVWVEAP